MAIVTRLIDAKAEIDQQSKAGYTVLMLAAEQDHEAVINVLLDAGAQVDICERKDGDTALMYAVFRIIVERRKHYFVIIVWRAD